MKMCELNQKQKLAYNRAQMTSKTGFNLFDYFLSDERLNEIGSRVAIEFRDQQYTYTELKAEVQFWASELARLHVREGDRVALLLYDSPEFIACLLAAAIQGAICVPINTFLHDDEIRFILSDSGARLLIAERSLATPLFTTGSDNESELGIKVLLIEEPGRRRSSIIEKNLNGEPGEPFQEEMESDRREEIANGSQEGKGAEIQNTNDLQEGRNSEVQNPKVFTTRETPALLLYTSGSTGTPKGALHIQGNVAATVEGFGKSVLRLLPSDKVFSASRLYFAYGLGNSLSFPLAAGALVILQSERPTPQMIAGIFHEQKPTVFFAVPAVYRALLDLQANGASLDTASLRMCVSAGEALPATIFEEWKTVFGLTILDGIGSTEMLHMFISNSEGEAKAGSSGKVVPGYEAKILDDAGQAIRVGEQGNLWVKGASAMREYWQREDLTSNVMRDGWMRTGDVYRQDLEGYYFHIGRSDDCFKVKGLWVSPIEIEEVLLEHPEVSEAAVVVSTGENGLATAKAYLVIRSEGETLKDELYEFVKDRLPLYKTPTQYEFVKEMPRTSTGKIQRFKLRASSYFFGGTDES
jgi:benzoate-CoA ligase family protein